MSEVTPAPAPTPSPTPTPSPAPSPTPTPTPSPAPTPSPTPTPTPAPTPDSKGYWPEDWLARVSKGDEKRTKQLGQYASPEALAEAHIALRRRMDSGEVRTALPKDPKPEELTAWRKDNGIPEKADGYDLKGVEIPETDKEIVNEFLNRMHAKHATPEVAKEALQAYYQIEKKNSDARAAKDEEQRVSAIDTLAGEWGGKFSSYKARIENYLTMFPENVRDSLKSARLPDGTAVFNHPDVLRAIVALSLKDVPDGVVVPSGGGDLGKSMTDRWTEIQKYRRDERIAYNKNEKVQAEERNLIEAMQKHGLMDKNGNLQDRKAA